MTEEGRVVELTRKHLDRMVDLQMQTLQQHSLAFPNIFSNAHTPAAARRTLERFLPRWLAFDPFNGQGIGWEISDELAGYVLYQTYDHPLDFGLRPGLYAAIWDIAVDQARRRKGVGTGLIEELINRLRSEKVVAVDAQVWMHNGESAGLFERVGFKKVSNNFRRDIA